MCTFSKREKISSAEQVQRVFFPRSHSSANWRSVQVCQPPPWKVSIRRQGGRGRAYHCLRHVRCWYPSLRLFQTGRVCVRAPTSSDRAACYRCAEHLCRSRESHPLRAASRPFDQQIRMAVSSTYVSCVNGLCRRPKRELQVRNGTRQSISTFDVTRPIEGDEAMLYKNGMAKPTAI